MYWTLKRLEKKFCIIETKRWQIYGYLRKVGLWTIEFNYYKGTGEFIETLYIPMKEILMVSAGGKDFEKFCCNVSLIATTKAEQDNQEIKKVPKRESEGLLKGLLGWLPFGKTDD